MEGGLLDKTLDFQFVDSVILCRMAGISMRVWQVISWSGLLLVHVFNGREHFCSGSIDDVGSLR